MLIFPPVLPGELSGSFRITGVLCLSLLNMRVLKNRFREGNQRLSAFPISDDRN